MDNVVNYILIHFSEALANLAATFTAADKTPSNTIAHYISRTQNTAMPLTPIQVDSVFFKTN
jgi:hypothetical protein